jgi:siroheme decarboxylase
MSDCASRCERPGQAPVTTWAPDAVDRRIVLATQGGLPLTPRPYHALATQLGVDPDELMERIRRMQAAGAIRRIGAVPNHYALGYRANGMSVWDVPDERVGELGAAVGALDFVSHCYHRPRHPPDWPYNLFAMVHGRTREEVDGQVAEIAALLGAEDRGHLVLYSTRILKKTGMRLRGE